MGSIERDIPEFRTMILTETLKQVCQIVGESDCFTVWMSIQKATGLSEESYGHEVMAALSLLIRGGLVECNSYNALTGSISYGCDTRLQPSPRLTQFIWDEQLYAPSEDYEEEDGAS